MNGRQVQVRVPVEGTGGIFAPGAEVIVGRGDDVAVAVRDLRASRHHAVLRNDGGEGWVLEDLSSRGTFVDGRQIQRVVIDGPRTVRLGDAYDGVVVEVAPTDAPADHRPPSAASPVSSGASTGAGGPLPGGRAFPAPPVPTAPPGWNDGPPPTAQSPVAPVSPSAPTHGRRGSMPAGGISVPREGEVSAIAGAGVELSSVYQPAAVGRIRIGRGADNDIVIPDLLVSRNHAELRSHHGRHQIIDLASHNGTYVDGRRVTRADVTEQSVITVGHHLYRLRQGRLEEYIDRGQASFAAVNLRVLAGERTLLNDVSFALGASAFLCVLGPSGAGKSTLVKALTGARPADTGTVLYNGRNLYEAYPELRHRIGYVPQDDILHPQLTVRQALGYAARLRFPLDVTAAERDRRVDEVMAELGLGARAELPVANLSGGQRKRVSVAVELLTRPSLILLDEPTSGLDPGYEKSVMTLLRTLADSGRTVITVTHSIQSLDLCDRLLFLAPGGSLGYFGPPDEALGFFGQEQYADVFQLLERAAPGQAQAAFAQSPLRQMYVDLPLSSYGNTPTGAFPAVGGAGGPLPGGPVPVGQEGPARLAPLAAARPNATGGHQLASLLRRYLAVIVADRRNTLLLLLQAPLLGLLMMAVLGSGHLHAGARGQGTSTQVLVALTLSATYLGATNSIREIVKERAILTRERSVGLSAGAYVVSKVLVLGVLTVIQAIVLTLLATARQHGPGHGAVFSSGMLELLIVVSLTGLAAMSLGLMISALVTNPDKALTLLPILLFAEFLLSGGAFKLGPVVRDVGYLTGARWGDAAASATVDVDALVRDGCHGAPSPRVNGVVAPPGGHSCNADYRHDGAAWTTDMVWLIGLTAAPLIVAVFAIRPIGQPRRR